MTMGNWLLAVVSVAVMLGFMVVRGYRFDAVNLGLVAVGAVAIVAILMFWPVF